MGDKKLTRLYRVSYNRTSGSWYLESEEFSETKKFYIAQGSSKYRIDRVTMWNADNWARSPEEAIQIRINQAEYDLGEARKRAASAEERLVAFRSLQEEGIE